MTDEHSNNSNEPSKERLEELTLKALYTLATNQNDAEAQFELALAFAGEKYSLPVDMSQAFDFCLKAAEQNYMPAQDYLSSMHIKGKGTKVDIIEGLRWAFKSVENGNTKDTSSLKNAFPDLIDYIVKADNGDAESMHLIAQLYLAGYATPDGYVFIEKNLDQVRAYLKKAIDRGHVESMDSLARILWDNKELEDAFVYFKNAAKLGYMDSQKSLGFCYMTGRGTKVDKKNAKHWFAKAAEQGDEYSKNALRFV